MKAGECMNDRKNNSCYRDKLPQIQEAHIHAGHLLNFTTKKHFLTESSTKKE